MTRTIRDRRAVLYSGVPEVVQPRALMRAMNSRLAARRLTVVRQSPPQPVKAGLHDPSPGAPPVARGPSAARRHGAATALPNTRLHCSPRFSHHLGFLPIFLSQAPPPTGRAARNPLRGRGFASTLRDRWTEPSKLVMRVRFPSSALVFLSSPAAFFERAS
jgi:hypothetical protein